MVPRWKIFFLKYESTIFTFLMSENKLAIMQNIYFVKSCIFLKNNTDLVTVKVVCEMLHKDSTKKKKTTNVCSFGGKMS